MALSRVSLFYRRSRRVDFMLPLIVRFGLEHAWPVYVGGSHDVDVDDPRK
ncbi:hypothetical protein TanjilG_20906 [Lupinus angustifolius]|uniref:Uncharacterized protein n=1 Tax=Lupinus angustifolius TaxID=3871 RepID=A0A1J7FNB7_LUPAN|nr:hypothetical protein TanjilG_20906 [Lupinus angustifolius]